MRRATMKRLSAVAHALICGALFCSSAFGESPTQTDTIVLRDGGTITDCVVMDEDWREVTAYRPSDSQTVTFPRKDVEQIEFNTAPLLYRVAMTDMSKGRWRNAADTLAQVAGDAEAVKAKPWVKQHALYGIAEARRVLAELGGDSAALGKAAEDYSRLLREAPETRFKHDALLALARCAAEQAAFAGGAEEKAAAVKRAEEAFTNYEETCKKDFADAAFAAALAERLDEARLGRLELKYSGAAGADDLAKIGGEFGAIAGEAGKGEEIALEAGVWAGKCALDAADKSGADATGAVGELGALIDKIAASGLEQGARERLFVQAYLALGGHYYERAQALTAGDPNRRNVLYDSALAYLRIALLYPLAAGAERECQDAFYRAVLIMKELGEVRLAKSLLGAMGEKFEQSDFWKNTASTMMGEG